MYVVARDFGFAPNPFHGYCTLATCMPRVRKGAEVGDWVAGVGGSRLKATGQLVYAMRVSEVLTFGEYWSDPRFLDKKPVRNGSRVMLVGDNIYSKTKNNNWLQADSHHSNPDGSPNPLNVNKDTSADRVLVSDHFYYFGNSLPRVPAELLKMLGYKNGIGHRKFNTSHCEEFVKWLRGNGEHQKNFITADPCDFEQSSKRYAGTGNKLQ
jgi:Nucleotide modification associated domain 2